LLIPTFDTNPKEQGTCAMTSSGLSQKDFLHFSISQTQQWKL